MMKKLILTVTLTLCCLILSSQDSNISDLPYETIGSYPSNTNANGIMQRLIDGLGYRLHWATADLSVEDQNYWPDSSGVRTIAETMDHIKGLTEGILLFAKGKPIERSSKEETLSFDELRKISLENLKTASQIISEMSEEELFARKLEFKRGDLSREFEMWHIINGQISDAIYHVGQIVLIRRASGNALDGGVNVFMGVTK